jgi:hypothetical protein
MKILEYLYCRFYQFMVSVGNGDIAAFASVMFMTFMITLNVVTVFDLLSFFGHGISFFSKPIWIAGLVSLAVVLYFLLSYNGKSARILSQYEGESKRERMKGRIIVISYIVLSMAAVIGSFFLLMMKNRGEL